MSKRSQDRVVCGISTFPLEVLLMKEVVVHWLHWWNEKRGHFDARSARLSLVKAGRLNLPTGRLIALDPLTGDDQKPIPGRLPAGRYDVFRTEARVEKESKVHTAALALRVSNRRPQRFSPGPTISVDSATVAFVDASARRALFSLVDDREPDEGYAKIWASTDGSLVLDTKTRANVVVCTPGHGDGSYRVWRGFDASGAVCVVVVEFKLVMPIEEVLRHSASTLTRLVMEEE
jgi:hypothetical protein